MYRLFEEGLEKGLEKAIFTYMRKNPELSDAQIAAIFEVKVEFIERLRAKGI